MTDKPRLPVVGSTAATTAFCSDVVWGPGPAGQPIRLHFDGNGKITAGNGTLAAPRPNAFSLVQIETCPGSTPTCRSSCYVHNLEAAQKAIHDLYKENTENLRAILADEELANEWAMIVAGWIRERAPGGFRWHVSGDVMSREHAAWIADVCRESPEVGHWIYTRSFEFAAPLAQVSTNRGGNLALNFSCDRDNWEHAFAASRILGGYDEVPPIRLCYLVVEGDAPPAELGLDDVIFPDYALRPKGYPTLADSPWWASLPQIQRGLVCPVDAHGKAENRRCGPCSRCLT